MMRKIAPQLHLSIQIKFVIFIIINILTRQILVKKMVIQHILKRVSDLFSDASISFVDAACLLCIFPDIMQYQIFLIFLGVLPSIPSKYKPKPNSAVELEKLNQGFRNMTVAKNLADPFLITGDQLKAKVIIYRKRLVIFVYNCG